MAQLKKPEHRITTLYIAVTVLSLIQCMQLFSEDKNIRANSKNILKSLTTPSAIQCALRCTILYSCDLWRYSVLAGECVLIKESIKVQIEAGNKNSAFRKIPDRAFCFLSCHHAKEAGRIVSSVYRLCPNILVYCDMETDGGGWALFQRRMNGIEPFNRTWIEYKNGFGNLTQDHWLGLDAIRNLLWHKSYAMRIDLYSWEGEHREAKYTKFEIADESDKYRLTIGNYSGNAGDSMAYQNGQKFTTYDQDNDGGPGSCSLTYGRGGWWYALCHHANLNGLYCSNSTCPHAVGVVWDHWKGFGYSLRGTQMKIRDFV